MKSNYIESLLGIETDNAVIILDETEQCCNYIESLLGIETDRSVNPQPITSLVATILNPY